MIILKRHSVGWRLVGAVLFANLAGCNLPRQTSSNPPPTLTPPASVILGTEEGPTLSTFFVEDLETQVPAEWVLEGGWAYDQGQLSTSLEGAVLHMPGDWQDMTFFLKFRMGSSGEFRLHFNWSEIGSYRIDVSTENLAAFWQTADGNASMLTSAEISLDEDWHMLVVRLATGRAEVLVDSVPYLKFFNAYESPRGSIRIQNAAEGQFEIDRIDLAPPGMGPGMPTPTAAEAS